MPALIDLRRRIKSVRNTQQITQAMKSVATAKFRKAQKAVLEGRIFWHSYPDLIGRIAEFVPFDAHPLLEHREERTIQVVVLTSDKGFAGSFNSNLLEKAQGFIEERSRSARVRLVLIGKKAMSSGLRRDYPVDSVSDKEVDKYDDRDFRNLSSDLIRRYALHEIDALYIIYNEFKSILAPRISVNKLLPVETEELSRICRPAGLQDMVLEGKKAVSRSDGKRQPDSCPAAPALARPDWSPAARSILNAVLPKYVNDQIRHVFHESAAAELAARMMAMENASRNAEELIEKLTLQLNKIRQALITKELLEIMTAVEALSEK